MTNTAVAPVLHVGLKPRPKAVTLSRIALLMLAGALPVSAIPLFVVGWLPMSDAALFLVLPAGVLALGLMLHGSPEAIWAGRGAGAGLAGVFAYDVVRVPLVLTGTWPDFIPKLGGWILGTGRDQVAVGYAWRYFGDGVGIGMAFFVFCAVVLAIRPGLVTAHPVALSIGYGIFIWSGLLGTVALLPRGQELMFPVSATGVCLTLVGHLIYGTVLGLCLRRALRATAPVLDGASVRPTAAQTRRDVGLVGVVSRRRLVP